MFLLQVRKNSLAVRSWELLSSGAVNENRVRFQFSADWDGLSRTAVFSAGEVSRSVLLAEDTMCAIPWEVLAEPRLRLYVGVYGVGDGGETVLPTVWADLGEIYPGVVPAQAANPGKSLRPSLLVPPGRGGTASNQRHIWPCQTA